MQKLKFIALLFALLFSFNATATEILPEQLEAADPFEEYPEAYQDNEFGEAAEKPDPTLVKPLPPVPSKTFTTDKRGNLVIK